MRLFYSPGACAMASYITLLEAHIPFESTRVELNTHRTSDGADFRGVSSKGYVPALLLDDGQLLTENIAVLLYIADLAPSATLAPPAGTFARYRLLEWLAFLNSEMQASMTPLFKPDTPEDAKPG